MTNILTVFLIAASLSTQSMITDIIEPIIIENTIKDNNVIPLSEEYWIDVSIEEQIVRLYYNDSLIDSAKVVTGTKNVCDTPLGKFSIYSKEESRTLTGYNADGSIAYQSYVDYWLPFYGNYGLHDAQWRDEFGEDIYLYNGSHGCVNLEHEFAKEIFDVVKIGTIVNIH